MAGRQCGSMKRGRFQKGWLVKIQHMASNITRSTIYPLYKRQELPAITKSIQFIKQLLNYIYSFVEMCEGGKSYDSLQTAKPKPTIWTMTIHGMLRRMLWEKNKMLCFLWKRKYGSIPERGKRRNNDTESVQCIRVVISPMVWNWH